MRDRRRPLRVKVKQRPQVPAGPIAAALFALVALLLLVSTNKFESAGPGRLANTGSDVSPWAIAAVILLVVGGIAFVVIGQRGRRGHRDE